MNRRAVWLCIVLLLIGIQVHSQCNYKLVEQAAEKAGSDAIYIRDFKVKLSKGTMDEPSPTGRFPVFLNKGAVYRFSLANDTLQRGRAFVELTRKNQSYAGNYIFEMEQYLNSFDFECDRSTTYQILINFGEGYEGCAAVVLSLVLQDSMEYIDPEVQTKSDSGSVMYLWSETELQIATSSGKNSILNVSTSQGEVLKQGKFYIVKPEELGELYVNVEVMQNGLLVEKDSVRYKVEIPPLPTIILPDEKAGTISVGTFNGVGNIELINNVVGSESPYKLVQFSISLDPSGFNEITSYNDKLSIQQINLIKSLEKGRRLYILNAKFVDPEGNRHSTYRKEILISN